MKVNIDETRVMGAIAVLENHLNGAVADLEAGNVENIEFLEDCAYVHKLLEAINCKWNALIPNEYEERITKYKKEHLRK